MQYPPFIITKWSSSRKEKEKGKGKTERQKHVLYKWTELDVNVDQALIPLSLQEILFEEQKKEKKNFEEVWERK